MTIPKYRPVLTPDEVQHLTRILKQSYIDNLTKSHDASGVFSKVEEDYCLQLMNKFSALDAKIQNNIGSVAYTSKIHTPREEMLLDLGGTIAAPISGSISIGARRLAAYEKYLEKSTSCTATEIADAMEYRFQNDIMGELEAAAYEAKQWERSKL
jgi:hypothetical protein